MLSISGADFVLWVHVIAACVWIGGQATVALLIPLLRGQEALARLAGQRYQMVAWPAYAILVITGLANVSNAGLQWSSLLDSALGRTLAVKLGLVAVSGLAAGVHAFLQAPRRSDQAAGRPVASAVLGSVSLLTAMFALCTESPSPAPSAPTGRAGQLRRSTRFLPEPTSCSAVVSDRPGEMRVL